MHTYVCRACADVKVEPPDGNWFCKSCRCVKKSFILLCYMTDIDDSRYMTNDSSYYYDI